MNPMRALMQIPLRNPPRLAEPEKWSRDFSNFLELCLDKDPKKRATIDQLLVHPFLTVCGGKGDYNKKEGRSERND
jgi:serine/threonine-protein kinase 10